MVAILRTLVIAVNKEFEDSFNIYLYIILIVIGAFLVFKVQSNYFIQQIETFLFIIYESAVQRSKRK